MRESGFDPSNRFGPFSVDIVHHVPVWTGRRRTYEFATTFYPLWAGIASAEQASRVQKNLPRFEAPGGLLTSTKTTGNQWDAPFGWAPLQLIGAEGLSRAGFKEDADRIARTFLSLVAKEFGEHRVVSSILSGRYSPARLAPACPGPPGGSQPGSP